MQSQLSPYINFKDNARQAMEFYQTVFGGKLSMDTFKSFGVSQDPAEDEKIMNASLQADNGLTFMAADTPNAMPYVAGTNISMALSGDNEAELSGYFDKLSTDGGQVVMPLGDAPWGDKFGMCTDKFGVNWMVDISPAKTAETA